MKNLLKSSIILLMLLVILTLTSCKNILLKIYGIKDPKTENEISILKYAEEKKLHTDNIVTVTSKDFLSVIKGKGIPDADIFDANGEYIEYRKTASDCNAALFQFIPDLNKEKKYDKTGKTNLSTELNRFRDLKGNPLQAIPTADFYVLIYWNAWTGKLNNDHVKIWEDYAYANKNATIKVLKIDLDFQEYWNKAERDSIIKHLDKKIN